jgi:hypothetical protein
MPLSAASKARTLAYRFWPGDEQNKENRSLARKGGNFARFAMIKRNWGHGLMRLTFDLRIKEGRRDQAHAAVMLAVRHQPFAPAAACSRL